MPTAILLENDISKTLTKSVKPKGIQLNKALNCKIVLDVDKDGYKALDDDPLLLAKCTEAASKAYKEAMLALAKELKKADAEYLATSIKSEREKIAKAFESTAKNLMKLLATGGAAQAKSAWDVVAKTKTDYTKYKVKAGVDLAYDGFSVGMGIAGAVGTGGFSLILSICSIIKTLISMSVKVYKLAIDADKMQKKVVKGLTKVQKSFDKKKKEASSAKDTGKVFINQLLGSDFLPTIKSVKGDNDQYGSKIKGVDVESHKLAKNLNDVLKAMDKAMAQPDVKSSKTAQKALTKLQGTTHKLIEKVIAMQEKVHEGQRFYDATDMAIKEIETLQPKKWKVIQRGMFLTDVVIGSPGYSSATDALKAVGEAVAVEVGKEIVDRV